MMFSGSVLTDRTDEYSIGDVGFEVHDKLERLFFVVF